MKLKVLDFNSNKEVEELDLDDFVFNGEVRKDILARVVKWQMAKARSGNHKTKTRAEVNHTTKKPFKQKGTGRARQGMRGVSQMRGGGVVFGPLVRSHAHDLPKKVRVMGLRSAISSKVKENDFIILDNLNISDNKTSLIKKKLLDLGINNALFVDGTSNQDNDKFKQSIKNLYKLDFLPVIGLNVLDILKHKKLIFTKDSINGVMERVNAN